MAATIPLRYPEHHAMSFSDVFQTGMSKFNNGQTDNTLRNGLLIMIGLVAIIGLALHLRQRFKHKPELNSPAHLGRELCRVIPFPFGTRVLLWWVARCTHVHLATLLLSAQAFETSVTTWSSHGTFSPLRRWGASRLEKLKQLLFEARRACKVKWNGSAQLCWARLRRRYVPRPCASHAVTALMS